jgi:hypothetical protein
MVKIDLMAKMLEGDYFWRWGTNIQPFPGAEGGTHFDQSQIQGMVLSASQLRKSASDFVPRLSEDGCMRKRALELMDGKSSLEEIARRLTSEFPSRFPRWQQALSFTGNISKEDSV